MNHNKTPNNSQNTRDQLDAWKQAFPESVTPEGNLDFSKGYKGKSEAEATSRNKAKPRNQNVVIGSDEWRSRSVHRAVGAISLIGIATPLGLVAVNTIGAPVEVKASVPITVDEGETNMQAIKDAYKEAGVEVPEEILNQSESELLEEYNNATNPVLEVTERGRLWKVEDSHIVDGAISPDVSDNNSGGNESTPQ